MLGAAGGGIQRLLELRHLAMQAFINEEEEFQPGDIVYVYRVPLQRRRAKHDDSLKDKEGRRATWVGPGTIVMTEGANAWRPPKKQRQRISYKGSLKSFKEAWLGRKAREASRMSPIGRTLRG